MKYQKHHMLWERLDYTTPLEKRVRRQFTISAPDANHRLLHLLLAPPPKPNHQMLQDLLEVGSPQMIDRLPASTLRHHFERQIEIINYDPDEVHRMIGGISTRRGREIQNTLLIIDGMRNPTADMVEVALQEQRWCDDIPS